MPIEQIILRQINLPYVHPLQTSQFFLESSHSIIVQLIGEGVTGWGEAPLLPVPAITPEYRAGAWLMMNRFLAPLLLDGRCAHPDEVSRLLQPIRGHHVAKAGLEMAFWDWWARKQRKSLSACLGGSRAKIPVGVSVGIQPDLPTLLEKVGDFIAEGYRRIKLKIQPGWDIAPVRAVRERWPDVALQVDANSAYTAADQVHLAGLDPFNLLLLEQPLGHEDLVDHAQLQRGVETAVCLDESITSLERTRHAIYLDAARVINIKPARVGGLSTAKAIHDLTHAHGIPVWCGGMMETGIGRATNVALASLPNFSLPGDVSANAHYFQRDLVANPFTLNPDSTITVPNTPGNGAEVDIDYLARCTTLQQRISAKRR
jgi:O-succinylbenzoate synthase